MTKRKERRRKAKPRSGRQRAAAAGDETRKTLGLAVNLLQAGQQPKARSLLEQVLEREPHNADALHFLGLCRFQSGDAAGARELIERAILEKPRVAPYHDNLAKVLEHQGELDHALDAYHRADELEPGVADRQFNMGVVLQRIGRLQEARHHLERAIDSNPRDADYHFNLGYVLKDQGRYADAAAAYRNALALDPQSARIKNNLGNALLLSGDAPAAVNVLQEAVRRSPANASVHNNLGNALRELGRLEEAARSYRRALEIDSSFKDAHRNLGRVLLLAGRPQEAARVFLRALTLSPDSPELRRGLVSAARHMEVDGHDPPMEAAVQSCMADEEVDSQELSRVAAAYLRARHGLESNRIESAEAVARALAGDEYALRLLETSINVDPVLEGVLSEIRPWLLGFAGGAYPQPLFRLACALAQQCFSNEYVFDEGEAETRAVEARVSDLGAALSSEVHDQARLCGLIAGVALYRPLYLLDCAELLAQKSQAADWPGPLHALIVRALAEPREEARIETGIRRLGVISDATSLQVRDQYETNPYPRWLRLPRGERQSYGAYLRRQFPGFDSPPSLEGPVRVLIAGCGTGFEALAAAANRVCSSVLGVDLSRASLAYAVRAANKLGVDKVDFVHGDVLDLPSAGGAYEVVESSGVLHHLADPMRGLKALADCLLPGGVMKVGLYSERARKAIVAARELIRQWGVEADPAGIRRIRARILRAGEEDPLHELKASEDLYSTSACRDLLFHVCEHRFTLDQIRAGLDRLGLRFIGFETPFPFMRARFRALNPGGAKLDDLDAWARVEQRYPDTFAAMYVFWCQKPP